MYRYGNPSSSLLLIARFINFLTEFGKIIRSLTMPTVGVGYYLIDRHMNGFLPPLPESRL